MARSSVDRISSLPDGVREQILMCLPIRDAVKCSVLSTKWKNLWTYLPALVIGNRFGEAIVARERRSKDYRVDVAEKLIMLDVCKVLMLHQGPLKDFSLSFSNLGDQLDQVLRFLPYNTLQSLTIVNRALCMLSKTVFTSFSQLKTLSLSGCAFRFSVVSFDGFDRLTRLELRNVACCGRGGEAQLIIRCPLLTTLILERVLSPTDPRILVEAPRLECLYLFRFRCDSLLLGEAVGTVETLSIGIGHICEYITSTEPWVKLRQLSLAEFGEQYFSRRSNVLAVVRTIMNSPNLQRLEIQMKGVDVDDSDYDSDIDPDDNPDDEAVGITELRYVASEYEQLQLLTKVEVKRLRGRKNEMTLISWLLDSIPALDEMKIKTDTALSKDKLLEVVIQLNKLKRASSNAQIIIN